jgi:hypothetical protein
MTTYVQGEGSFQLGPVGGSLVEYGTEIPSATILRTRGAVILPATLGEDEENEELGVRNRSLQIELLEKHLATGVWGVLAAAYESATGELDFSLKADSATTSTDNRVYTGTILVKDLSLGGTVGQLRRQSITFKIKAGTYAEDDGT